MLRMCPLCPLKRLFRHLLPHHKSLQSWRVQASHNQDLESSGGGSLQDLQQLSLKPGLLSSGELLLERGGIRWSETLTRICLECRGAWVLWWSRGGRRRKRRPRGGPTSGCPSGGLQ